MIGSTLYCLNPKRLEPFLSLHEVNRPIVVLRKLANRNLILERDLQK